MENNSADALIELYRLRPTDENIASLITSIQRKFAGTKDPRGLVAPALGVLEVMRERHPMVWNWRRSIAAWMFGMAVKPEFPRYNDYLMAKWMLTGDIEYVERIHRRVMHTEITVPAADSEQCLQIETSGSFMIKSMLERDPLFASQMCRAVDECEFQCAKSGPGWLTQYKYSR